jgi:tetratricopeptide (TPR) repeat protein
MKNYFIRFGFAVFVLTITSFLSFAGTEPQQEEIGKEATLYGEEEYNAYTNAANEPDYEKRGDRLVQFTRDYPKTALMPYVSSAYRSLLFFCREEEQYELLGFLADKWLEIQPNNLWAIGYSADAAKQLGHHQKYVRLLERIYEVQPSGDTAREIALVHKELGDHDGFVEWAERIFSDHPEYNADYELRYLLMLQYVQTGEMDKAAEYARLSLKAAGLVTSRDPAVLEHVGKVRHSCYDTIGKIQYSSGEYSHAVKSFQEALNLDRYSEGYYFIGLSLWNMKRVDDGMIFLAAAELQDDGCAPKAKDNLERLYRSIHNNTTVGIHKVYNKAKDLMAGKLAVPLILDNLYTSK